MKHVNILPVKQGTGKLVEIYLENGLRGGRILCPQNLIPKAGQYLLAYDPESNAPLPAPIFKAGSIPGGFLLAPPIPNAWQPGITLSLRGPLGHGFSLPESARCVALVALGETSARMKPLLADALAQGAAVVLVSDLDAPDLPPEVELQPLSALTDVVFWADYAAFDAPRESLPELREMLGLTGQERIRLDAQVLVGASMPCGGMAVCGVCAVRVRRGWKMACKDGPVFDLNELV